MPIELSRAKVKFTDAEGNSAQINTMAIESLEDIQQLTEESIANVNTAKASSLGDISDATTQAINALDNAIGEVPLEDADDLRYTIAENATSPTTKAYAVGEYFYYGLTDDNKSDLCRVTKAIASGDIIYKTGANKNCESVTRGIANVVNEEVADLKSAIDDLGVVSFSALQTQEGIINSSGNWASISSSNLFKAVPINSGDTVKVSGNGARNLYIAFLRSKPVPVNAASANLSTADGFTSRIAVGYSSTESYTAPSDATYLWVQTASAGNDTTPSELEINGYDILETLLEHLNEIEIVLANQSTNIGTLQDDVDVIETAVENKQDAFIPATVPFAYSGYIKPNGSTAGGASWVYSDYVLIPSYIKTISYKLAGANTVLIIAFYDENKTYINNSGVPGAGSATAVETGTVNVPNGAKYYRACNYITLLSSGYYVQQIIPADVLIKTEQEIDVNSQSIASNQGRIGTLELMESIDRPFDFSGKVITAFGDSITQGVTSPNMQMATPYIEYFGDHVGATVSNKAVSGKCISGDDANSIYQKVLALTGATDYIVIAGGTNDYATDKPLGEYSSTAGTSTFYGALKGICDFLAANYATTPVIFITPIPLTRYTPDRKNAEGCLLDDYRRAIYQIATLYGHSVVNGASLGMPNTPGGWGNAMIDDADGVHPTGAGHKLMARSLAGKLL